MSRPFVPYLSIVVASLLFGCSSEATVAPNQTGEQQATKLTDESFSHIISAETEYYMTGPQQGRPLDGKFPAGTKVKIIQAAGSYTHVQSEDGVEAYVTSDAVKEIDP